MNFWSLGVSIPVDNRSFKIGSYGEDQLGTLYTAGLTLPMNSDNRNLFGTKDTIIVGPSNNASHSGKSETAIVAAIGSDYITLKSSLTYNYAASDYVSGLGNRVAGGWLPQTTYNNGFKCLGFDQDGKNHNSAQKISMTEPEAASPTRGELRQVIPSGNLLPSTVHRIGFYYKFILDVAAPTFLLHVNDGGTINLDFTITTNNVPTYRQFTISGPLSSTAGNSDGRLDFVIVGSTSDIPHQGTAYIDQVFMEHAKGTDGSGLGFYTFTEYPERGSVSWDRIDSFKRIPLRNLATKIYDSSGTQGKQYMHTITAQFVDVSSVFYENLLVLLNYQLDGSLLVLHHDVENIAPTSYGLMTLSNFRYNNWCQDLVSFTFIFEEIV